MKERLDKFQSFIQLAEIGVSILEKFNGAAARSGGPKTSDSIVAWLGQLDSVKITNASRDHTLRSSTVVLDSFASGGVLALPDLCGAITSVVAALRAEAVAALGAHDDEERRLAMLHAFYVADRDRGSGLVQGSLADDFGVEHGVIDRWVATAMERDLLAFHSPTGTGDRVLKITSAGIDRVDSVLASRGPQRSDWSQVTYVGGDQITQNIHGSTVGIAVAGRKASVGGTASLTQAEWKADIRSLQEALVRDQDALDELQEGMYEGLSQVLRLLRDVSVNGEAQETVLAQIKDVVDDVWVERELPRLRAPFAEALELLREAAKLASPLAQLGAVLAS